MPSQASCGLAGVLTLQREQDLAYGLTLLWSLVAVYATQWRLQTMRIVSLGCIVVLFIATVVAVLQKQRQRKYCPLQGNGLDESLQSAEDVDVTP